MCSHILMNLMFDLNAPADIRGEVHATAYHNLGIDVNTTTVRDLSGRPTYGGGRQPAATPRAGVARSAALSFG